MRRSLVPSANVHGKINLVPLIDVCLVLVVILLMTAPVLSVRDLGIVLPEARSRGVGDDLKVSITMGMNGDIAVDETLVPRENLIAHLVHRIEETDPDVLVVIRADAGMPYEAVAGVIQEAKNAGAKRLAIAAQPAGNPILPEALESLRAERMDP